MQFIGKGRSNSLAAEGAALRCAERERNKCSVSGRRTGGAQFASGLRAPGGEVALGTAVEVVYSTSLETAARTEVLPPTSFLYTSFESSMLGPTVLKLRATFLGKDYFGPVSRR